jgi:WD40 repeat protein/DNA polymerase III delta prime subunit
VTPIVRSKLSNAHAVRLDQTVKLIDEHGRAVLADVLSELYPRLGRDDALTGLRQFRRAVALAAEEAGVEFSLETDGQTRSAPGDRVVWFEAEDRVTEEVLRMVDAEVGDVKLKRVPQDAQEELIVEPLPQPEQPVEEHLRRAIGEFDEKKFVHTEGVATTLTKGLEAAPEIDPSQRKDAIEFLMEWIKNDKAPPYCALLGEYGMGKTTTCKALARELLDQRERGEKVLLPIYLDLRYVGESARREMALSEILDLILKQSWKSGPDGTRLGFQELIELVDHAGALVIWDGLDEVLVHLSPNAGQMFTRQLFRILPPDPQGEPRKGRLLISCRTHYFRTLRDQQTHFRAEDRDNVRVENYRTPFELLPFTEKQIRQYIEHTLPEDNPDRVMEVLRTVHNLTEMAERPYTLSLVAEQFARIEQWKAEGRRVTGLTLYRHIVLSWLERDRGKHQLTQDHKQALMEQFAAALWRAGARSWRVEDLEHWLVQFLEARPDLGAHYRGKAPDLLKEDLRTATFLVREGEDRFRFAHTSLQEYFLAGYLRRTLVEGRPEAWALPQVSPETLEFPGQWLAEESEHRDGALATLGALRDVYRLSASELAFTYFLAAHRDGYPAPTAAGFQLPGADLSEWEIHGSEAAPLVLAGANFRGAQLWNSRWRNCNLEAAVFDLADGLRAEWPQCHLAGSSWREASLEATVFRDCQLRGADFAGARCGRTQWLRCQVEEAAGLPAGPPKALYALCGGAGNGSDGAVLARIGVATGHQASVMCCAWSPDGMRIVSASDDHTLRIWEATSGKCLATIKGHQGGANGCAWSPDGKRIVSASYDKTLRIWEATSGKCLATIKGHQGGANGCAWSPDGKRVVSASEDHTLRIWEAESGRCLATLAGHQYFVKGCAWSPGGDRIVSVSYDETLRIWEATSGNCLATIKGHQGGANGCAWSPDGKRIVSASDDKTLRIWEATSGKCLATLAEHPGRVLGSAWSPEGMRIVSASADRTLRIWEARSGKCVAALAGHQLAVRGCAWSPDGMRAVSASHDYTLRIWEANSGECLAPLVGHQRGVLGCAWSPDGMRIVSASGDHTLRIWEANSGKCLAVLAGHQNRVMGCAWSPDGERIVSASSDGTVRLWDAATGAEVAAMYHPSALEDEPAWCAVDYRNKRILACSENAWRSLGWVAPEPGTGLPEWLPAETFGPLPVFEGN